MERMSSPNIAAMSDEVRDSYQEENMIHMSDIDPQALKSEAGDSTVKVN